MRMQIWNENVEWNRQCLVSHSMAGVFLIRDQALGKWKNRMRIAETTVVLCMIRGDKATRSSLTSIMHPLTRKDCYILSSLVSRLPPLQLDRVAEWKRPKRPGAVPQTW